MDKSLFILSMEETHYMKLCQYLTFKNFYSFLEFAVPIMPNPSPSLIRGDTLCLILFYIRKALRQIDIQFDISFFLPDLA